MLFYCDGFHQREERVLMVATPLAREVVLRQSRVKGSERKYYLLLLFLVVSSIGGTTVSEFLRRNLITLRRNKLTPMTS